MIAHTPWPWRAKECAIEGPDSPSGRSRVLAVCTPAPADKRSAERARANARLMAAAPELLAALRQLLDVTAGDQRDPEELRKALGVHAPAAVEQAEAAIAKAEKTA